MTTTRLPRAVQTYLKSFAVYQGRTLNDLMASIIADFCKERPWLGGMRWRVPKRLSVVQDGQEVAATGWVQVNILLDEATNTAFQAVLDSHPDVSRASCAYTAIHWWVQYIHPPKQ